MAMFNEVLFIEQALASILTQTFRDFELIVVDDGSTDGSAKVVEACGDPRVRLIRQVNGGLASALNRGIREASSPWIARQDADDVSLPERLQLQFERIESSPELVVLGTNALLTDEGGVAILTTEYPQDDASLRRLLFSGVNPFNHGSVIFRREAAIEAGLYRAEFRRSQDFDLWLRLSDRGLLGNLPQALYRWRMRRGGLGVSRSESQRDYGRLALICARRRQLDLPEPPLDIATVPQGLVVRLLGRLRQVDARVGYDFSLAKLLLRAGEPVRARFHALAVVRLYPLNVYAWLLVLLTYTPGGVARRVWNASARLYRRIIWGKKTPGGE